MAQHDIIAIGGSAGSGTVLKQILSGLPQDLPASVLISTHIPAGSSYLAEMLRGSSALPVSQAVDGQPLEHGRVYVAAPDRHLLLVDHTIRLGYGPRENMARPAIDAMFRSAAYAFGPRVIGVVLTGYLSDGAAGLAAIKQRGGLAVVQHPVDAEVGDMPRAALEAVDADHVALPGDMAALLVELSALSAAEAPPPRPELRLEIEIAGGRYVSSDQLREIADPSTISCPECHGVLSEMKGEGPLRYRCQIGHAYTADAVGAAQQPQVDEALRIALRMMEERHTLVVRMAEDARISGRTAVAELYEGRADEYRRHATTLRRAAVLALERDDHPAEAVGR
jgi:two-component system chemotaxis response regulator CheB